MEYRIDNGVYKLGLELSLIEKYLFDYFENKLIIKGFNYISVPSVIKKETFETQEISYIKDESLKIDENNLLAGSAEQGILEYFRQLEIKETLLLYAKNQCFRKEIRYEGLKYCKEFIKLEQFSFTNEKRWKQDFELLLDNSEEFLYDFDIKYRVVDVTSKDVGYHKKKYDIEIKTKEYGWLETHSCTYFGLEQSKRFGITGVNHTISNTGIASPRILVPFIEDKDKANNLMKNIKKGC